MTTYKNMTVEHVGCDATESDLQVFRALCEEAQRLNPDLDDNDVTDAVWGDGDYFCNAKKLGVDVDAIIEEQAMLREETNDEA